MAWSAEGTGQSGSNPGRWPGATEKCFPSRSASRRFGRPTSGCVRIFRQIGTTTAKFAPWTRDLALLRMAPSARRGGTKLDCEIAPAFREAVCVEQIGGLGAHAAIAADRGPHVGWGISEVDDLGLIPFRGRGPH